MISILIPSRTDEYLDACLTSLQKSEPRSVGRVFVYDNGLSDGMCAKWGDRDHGASFLRRRDEHFVFAKAINECAALTSYGDFLVLNDDARVVEPFHDWLTVLEAELARPDSRQFGMIGLRIRSGGVGNSEEQSANIPPGLIVPAYRTLCFVAVVIRREVWQKVGGLDERFTAYGFDDTDYNRRVRAAGFKIGVTGSVVVEHGDIYAPPGFGRKIPFSSSYARYHGVERCRVMFEENQRRFEEKWNPAAEEETPASEKRAVIGETTGSHERAALEETPAGPERAVEHETHAEKERAVAVKTPTVRKRCLNIGSGEKPMLSDDTEHWVNLDAQALPGVDVVRDVRRGLPFADVSFDHVLADNVLEHLAQDDAIFLLNEIDRVLKIGGTAEIIVPHAHSQGAFQDPSHRSFWVPRSALYWSTRYTPFGGPFVGITADFEIVHTAVEGDMATEAFIRFSLRKGDRHVAR